MEKIDQSHEKHIGPTTLYLDDVKRIVDIMTGPETSPTIEADNFRMDSVEELSDLLKEEIHDLKIVRKKPYVSLELSPRNAWLHIKQDDDVSWGIFERVKNVLAERKKPFSWLLHTPVLQMLLILAIMAIPFLGGYTSNNRLLTIVPILTSVPLLAWWFVYTEYHERRWFSTIILKNRIESPSFLKRNRDTILIALIGAILGGLLLNLAQHLIAIYGG